MCNYHNITANKYISNIYKFMNAAHVYLIVNEVYMFILNK
jgi:hypothetical protein